MNKTKKAQQLSLSDLIRNGESFVEDFNEIPTDCDAEYGKEYDIGIYCHSKFIKIRVRYRNGKFIQKAQVSFSTRWDDLNAARDWCLNVLKTKTYPVLIFRPPSLSC